MLFGNLGLWLLVDNCLLGSKSLMNTCRLYKCQLEWKLLVYCSKCGAKNEDDAKVCVGCGASLYVPKRGARRRGGDECFGPKEERRFEEECFGLPHGGAVIGIIFGVIVIFFGFAWLADQAGWIVGRSLLDYIWPVMAILFGILIIAGVIYGATRR